jgi:topoisomerase-4 subunit A
VRSGKGHEFDPLTLAFKPGDSLKHYARGRSNQQAVFLDSSGRAYSLPAHGFPSARGFGEPLSSSVNPPSDATFVGVMLGQPDEQYFLSTDAGYGFIAKLGDLYSRNKAGKAVISVPKGARVLPPVKVRSVEEDWIVAISKEGYFVVTELKEMPMLGRGKGIKFINIPTPRFKKREEFVAFVELIQDGESMTVYAGKKYKTMKGAEVDEYVVERARRGYKLPRGYQSVDRISIDKEE